MSAQPADRSQPKQALTLPLLAGLALLSASGPLATDMYLPALPVIVDDLATSPAMVQLTLSGFMLGLGVGQLIIGPISDSLGRRGLLIAGAFLQLVASIGCAVAPDMRTLIVTRLLQGLGGGACVVLARAVVPDLAKGRAAAKGFALLMTIQAIAPIVAPIAGGFLLEPIGWRGLFWVLAAIAALQLAVPLFLVRESKPVEERSPASVRGIMANYKYVLKNPVFRWYVVAFGFGFSVMFSYIAASSFVIQGHLGLSPQVYSIIFGVNAMGLMASNMVNARLVDRIAPAKILRTALSVMVLASTLIVVAALTQPTAIVILPLLFIAVSQIGMVMGNAMAVGTNYVRARAGSATALMGFSQFFLAALLSPLMGLGSNPTLTMGLGMLASACVALCGTVMGGRVAASRGMGSGE